MSDKLSFTHALRTLSARFGARALRKPVTIDSIMDCLCMVATTGVRSKAKDLHLDDIQFFAYVFDGSYYFVQLFGCQL